MTKSNLSASFPRKRESRTPNGQESIGKNRNRTDWIPACAGMTIFLFLIFCFWGMTGFEIAGIYRVKR
nr:hypothetical protein [Neisseria meningitidis]